MENENESFDEFIGRIGPSYNGDCEELDRLYDEHSSTWEYLETSDRHLRLIVRSSALSAFLTVLSFVLIHWLCFNSNKSIGAIKSYEIIALVGLLFFNLGIYAYSIFEKLNILFIFYHSTLRLARARRRIRRRSVSKGFKY